MSEEIPKALHLFCWVLLFNLGPQFPLSPALMCFQTPLPSFTVLHLSFNFPFHTFCCDVGHQGIEAVKAEWNAKNLFNAPSVFPCSPQVPFIIWIPQHGLNRRLPGQSDIHRQRTPPAPRTARERCWVGWRGWAFSPSARGTSWDGGVVMAMEGVDRNN